jgi:anti-sigma factor RsiW
VNDIGQHIPFCRLVDLVDGRLGAEDQAEIDQHLQICSRCASEGAWLGRVIGLMRADESKNPPAHVVAEAKRLFRTLSNPAGPGPRQQIAASLHFDSMQAPAAMGLRAGASAERQMLFATEEYLVDLRIAPSGELWIVSGQLLGAEAGEQVVLRGPIQMAQAPLNDTSEFVLPPAPPGSYTLTVRLPDADITIVDLELGA